MSDNLESATGKNVDPAIVELHQTLLQDGRALSGVAPVLSYLLARPNAPLITDEIVATMRGLLADLSEQFAAAAQPEIGHQERDKYRDVLFAAFSANSLIVSHCYALAIESGLTFGLQNQNGIDPVLPNVMQKLISGSDQKVAELAMATMASQARFIEASRRMDWPLAELPADLFDEVLTVWKSALGRVGGGPLAKAESEMRARFDEGVSRIGLLSRLCHSLGDELVHVLDLENAGLALFSSALSKYTRQPRELAVLACHEQQSLRLALSLRLANCDNEAIQRQLHILTGEVELPKGFESISQAQAKTLLAGASKSGGGRK